MTHPFFKGKRVLITGASSGIGQAMAEQCLRAGAHVILGGRDPHRLAQIRKGFEAQSTLLVGDLTDTATIAALTQLIGLENGGVDIAILNAGTARYIDADHFDASIFRQQMRENVDSMMACVEVLIPILLATKGQLALMSSLAAYGGLPRASAYAASKAAIRLTGQSLDVDLRPKGVAVTVICPGFVKTPLTDKNTFSMPFLMSVEKGARTILRGLEKRQHEIHFPYRFSLLMKLLTSLPSGLYYQLVRRLKP